MRFKVFVLRSAGRRRPQRDVMNGPGHVGDLLTHFIEIGGERYKVAKLRAADPLSPSLVPDLYEPVLLGFSAFAFRLRGFERAERGGTSMGVVQEWHCEEP